MQARLASDAEYLLAAVEPNWVEQRVDELRDLQDVWQRSGGRQQGSRSFHPLAVSASDYLAAPNAEGAYSSMGDNFLRLAMTGEALRLLDGVPGLDARVKNLTTGDDVRGHEKVPTGGQVAVPTGGQIEVPTLRVVS